ncbi:MAG: glycoside hydrolase [Candidatus Pacebacteria bacterium]|nr:glycoside hydrolase [Candidatus Paceibacterota bacterium]
MSKHLNATHGIVCRIPNETFGYFGWPTVTRMDDGTLAVASSGLRTAHICPFGKTVLNTSTDNGQTWSEPHVIQDSMIDDRDAGIVSLGGTKLLATWFRTDTRNYRIPEHAPEKERKLWEKAFAEWTDDKVNKLVGSWVMLSEDGGATWGTPVRAPVSAPHGPIQLRHGDLLYLGKNFWSPEDRVVSTIRAARSQDDGRTWKTVGEVPVAAKTEPVNYHEPHVVELPSGRLLGMIRIQAHSGKELKAAGIPHFSIMQTESDDGGRTWTTPKPLGFHGSPPHLLQHSSGTLVLTYGYRLEPFGQRVAFSRDEGATWEHDWIIRDDGPDGDLGYPATIELEDGTLFSVYYQKAAAGEKCSLLWSQWELPQK